MTIETCINFCTQGGFIFAGVEFGNCDSTTQIPSQPTPLSDCLVACSGNANEPCGGPNRLNVFTSNKPPPVIVQSVTGSQGQGLWTYQGCFTDLVTARTLGTGINIPGGVTAESCTAACQAAGTFLNAGLENGHECWCDNAVHAPTQRVSDNDCRMVCAATHTEYCGNQNRVAVYGFSASGEAPGPQACVGTAVGNFTLKAVLRNPPVEGSGEAAAVGLKLVAVEMVRGVLWTVLSVSGRFFSVQDPFFRALEFLALMIRVFEYVRLGMSELLLRMAGTQHAELDCLPALHRHPNATNVLRIDERRRVAQLRRINTGLPRVPRLLYHGQSFSYH
ncbi:hypothetical protein B0H34DRAFT_650627 [Crassisporium funariophilum]|nr:hypothetical protein B0H34DRAFT_650627 [Crassisporium funariophilum]